VHKEAWQADQFYRVQVGFPGKAGNEMQAPVVVHVMTIIVISCYQWYTSFWTQF
jgi:hypothetical protein